MLLAVPAMADMTCGAWQVQSTAPLEAAKNAGLDRLRLEQQLGWLGGTTSRLGRLVIDLGEGLLLPVAQLNALRRQLEMLLVEASYRTPTAPGAESERHQQIAPSLEAP